MLSVRLQEAQRVGLYAGLLKTASTDLSLQTLPRNSFSGVGFDPLACLGTVVNKSAKAEWGLSTRHTNTIDRVGGWRKDGCCMLPGKGSTGNYWFNHLQAK